MRKINELIWHCTATPEGREVSAETIDKWHRKRGWKGIGYHKVVHLDGTVSDGRPISVQGAHVRGHNRNSIGYVYVGGVDANMKAKDTRTPAQKETMRRLTMEAIRDHKLVKVSGHNQYAAKACPSFDAQREYADLLTNKNGMPKHDPAKLSKSRTLKGGAIGTIGVAGTSVSDAARQLQPFIEISDLLKYAFIALTIFGIGLMVFARLDDAGLFPNRGR
jgi:hypothetical protein